MAGRPLRRLRNMLRLNQNPRPSLPRGARSAAVDERVLLTLTAARPAALSVFEIVLNSGLMSARGILRPRHPNDPARSVRLDVEASLKRLLRSGDVTERKGSDLLPELTGYAATRLNPMVDGKFVSRRALAAKAKRAESSASDEDRARLGEKNLQRAKLSRASLSGADLSGVNLTLASLTGADLSGADLSGADLSGADLSGADLSGANLTGATLRSTTGNRVRLSGATLDRALLRDTWFTDADFSGASLRQAKVETDPYSKYEELDAGFPGAIFSGADLSGATFFGVDVRRVDFRGSNIQRAADLTDLRHDKTTLWPRGFSPGASYGFPEEHYPVRPPATEAFRRWFGESVIVDASGNPLLVYHGTNSGGFTKFDQDKVDAHQTGFYFTDNLLLASTYVKRPSAKLLDPAISPVDMGAYRAYLRVLRPLVVDGQGAQWDKLSGRPGVPKGHTKTYEIAAYAKKKGYDGVIFRDIVDTGGADIYFKGAADVYTVFSPTQVKSATANRGTFDPDDPDIRHNPPGRKARRPSR